MPGRRYTSAFQHPVELIENGSDVKIFVRIDATDDVPVRHCLTNFYAGSPGYTGYVLLDGLWPVTVAWWAEPRA